MLYGFLLAADPGGCDLAALSEKHLARALDAGTSRAGGREILELYLKMRPELEALNLVELYETIDLPLTRVLVEMETEGIRIDPHQLSAMSTRMEQEISALCAA